MVQYLFEFRKIAAEVTDEANINRLRSASYMLPIKNWMSFPNKRNPLSH